MNGMALKGQIKNTICVPTRYYRKLQVKMIKLEMDSVQLDS